MRDLRFWRWRKAQDDDVDREFDVHLAIEAEEQLNEASRCATPGSPRPASSAAWRWRKRS